MHLIREARHSQKSPSISAKLLNFLSNFYESTWDLATQGSSKSAQALKNQQVHSHGDPMNHKDATYPSQADPSLEQEKNGMELPIPTTQEFPSARSFDAPREEFANDTGFSGFSAAFDFGENAKEKEKEMEKEKDDEKDDEKDENKDGKGKRKKEKKGKKHKVGAREEPGEVWPTFGEHDSGAGSKAEKPEAAEKPVAIRESWPSFGNEHEMSFGIEDQSEQKQKRRHKDFQKELQDPWDVQDPPKESFVPHFGHGGDRPSLELDLPQPRARLGLPVAANVAVRDSGDVRDVRDPDYVARLEEILGVRHPVEAVRLDKENSRWAGHRHDGHFEERYRIAFMDFRDASPGVYVSLMGLKSNTFSTPRVLPEPAKPFLKSLRPNFQAL